MRRIFPLIALAALALLAATPAEARLGGRPPFATPYAGLLPDNFQLQPAPALDLAQLAHSKVVLIASGNLNQYAQDWTGYFEDGGGRNDTRGESFDPRAFLDRVAGALRPHVRELSVAADLPQARAQGADYYLIVDSWMQATHMGMRFKVTGGAYLLDSQLRSVFAADGQSEVVRGMAMNVREHDAQVMTEAMTSVSEAVLAQVNQRLGPPPASANQ